MFYSIPRPVDHSARLGRLPLELPPKTWQPLQTLSFDAGCLCAECLPVGNLVGGGVALGPDEPERFVVPPRARLV